MMVTEIARKPLGWFKLNPQARVDPGSETELRNLGESLRQQQLVPVGARADGELIYGFRRLKGARLVGLPELEVKIYSGDLSEAEIKSIRLTENLHRLDLKPYEKFLSIDELRRLNPDWTARQLGEQLKMDPSAVTKWLSPTRCIEPWREALRDNQVGITECYQASQLSHEEQKSLLELKRSGASRDALARAVQRNKPQSNETPAARSTRITIPLSSGTKVVISGTKLSLPEVIDKLVECLDAARKGLRERLDARTWQNVMRDKSQAQPEGKANV